MVDRAAAKIPVRVESTNLRELPIGPKEGYILSRVDGALTIDEIVEMVGLPPDDVHAAVDRLVELGAVEWAEPPRQRSDRPRSRSMRTDPPRDIDPSSPEATPGQDAPLYDAALLEEDVDLPRDRRLLILETFFRLEQSSHYQVLGVAKDADKGEIRGSYFALSKVFHPDTMFGKNLGAFKPKMEAIFKRITEAYEVLGKKKKRTEYDQYLSLLAQTAAAQTMLEAGEVAAERLRAEVKSGHERTEARREAVQARDAAPRAPGARAAPAPSPAPSPEPSPEPEPAPRRPRPAPKPVDPRRRADTQRRLREMHARRLRPRGRDADPREAPAPAAPAAPRDRKDVLRGLARSLRRVSTITGGVDKVERYLDDARAAEEAGQLLNAANALRLAQAVVDGTRPDIDEWYERVKHQLARQLADTYAKQATYEEENTNWAAAALSWSKVAEGRPDDPGPPRRAALALLKCDGDLRQARTFAQRAVELDPDMALGRRILGQVYLAAGMKLNARRELEEAAKLDPADDIVKNLLREARD